VGELRVGGNLVRYSLRPAEEVGEFAYLLPVGKVVAPSEDGLLADQFTGLVDTLKPVVILLSGVLRGLHYLVPVLGGYLVEGYLAFGVVLKHGADLGPLRHPRHKFTHLAVYIVPLDPEGVVGVLVPCDGVLVEFLGGVHKVGYAPRGDVMNRPLRDVGEVGCVLDELGRKDRATVVGNVLKHGLAVHVHGHVLQEVLEKCLFPFGQVGQFDGLVGSDSSARNL